MSDPLGEAIAASRVPITSSQRRGRLPRAGMRSLGATHPRLSSLEAVNADSIPPSCFRSSANLVAESPFRGEFCFALLSSHDLSPANRAEKLLTENGGRRWGNVTLDNDGRRQWPAFFSPNVLCRVLFRLFVPVLPRGQHPHRSSYHPPFTCRRTVAIPPPSGGSTAR